MAAIHIVLIGGIDHGLVVRAERDFFDVKISRGEEHRTAPVLGDRVQMIAAVLLGSEYDFSVGREVERTLSAQLGKRILQFISAVPYRTSCPRGRVSHPQRPRIGAHGDDRKLVLFPMSADEGNLLPVWRPAWHRIFIYDRHHV